MKASFRTTWTLLLYIIAFSEAKTYKCIDQSCSEQFADNADIKMCSVQNTPVCLNHLDNVTWRTNVNDKFSVSIQPIFKRINLSGLWIETDSIQVTFQVIDADVNAIAMQILKEPSLCRYHYFNRKDSNEKGICRLFDIENALNSEPRGTATFSYNCLHSLFENGYKNVCLSFTSLPSGDEQKYIVHLPAVDPSDLINNWQPIIMLSMNGLNHGRITVQFSPAAEHLNILKYTVDLIAFDELMESSVASNTLYGMMTATFDIRVNGYYSLLISSFKDNGELYKKITTVPFFVDYPYIVYTNYIICLFTFLAVIILICICLLWYKLQRLKQKTRVKPRVLLISFTDTKETSRLVKALADYLRTKHGLHVDADTIQTDDTKEWLVERIIQCDVILFVISKEFFTDLSLADKTNYGRQKLDCDHPYHNRLRRAVDIATDFYTAMANRQQKRMCIVRFNASSLSGDPKYVPRCLECCRPHFLLPQEMWKFLKLVSTHRLWLSKFCFFIKGFDDDFIAFIKKTRADSKRKGDDETTKPLMP